MPVAPALLPYPLSELKRLGHVVFEGVGDVNLVAVRHGRLTPGGGDDLLWACQQTPSKSWDCRVWPCETLPGPAYLRTPMNPNGTGIMAPGQFRRAYARGLHKGRPALVQVKPITAYRDANRNETIEIDPATASTGMFAMNVHDVTRWTDLAGCIGLLPDHLRELLTIYDQTAARYGPGLTLTLING